MNHREQQLRERDIRKDVPGVEASEFLRRYLASNFPQTAAIASKEQRDAEVAPMLPGENDLKSIKKPLSGTQYDKPGVN